MKSVNGKRDRRAAVTKALNTHRRTWPEAQKPLPQAYVFNRASTSLWLRCYRLITSRYRVRYQRCSREHTPELVQTLQARPTGSPLVCRRWHGARHPASRRQGGVVSQPVYQSQHTRAKRRTTPAAEGPRRGARDTVNTNVLKLAGKTLALVESGPFPFELDRNLDTVASTNLQGTLTAPFTAHPHEDPKTGEWHAITYESETQDTVWHVAINRAGRLFPNAPLP